MMKLIQPQLCLPVLSYGDFSEIYYERSKSLSIRWEEGRFEQATHGVDEGFGLRYRTGHETRFGSVDGEAEDLLGALSKTLTSGLHASTPKPFLAAPHKNVVSSPQAASNKSIDEKMRWIRKLYESASHPLLRQIQIGYGEVEKEIQILNSRGVWTYEIRSSLTLSVRVVAEKEGLQQTAYEVISGTGGWELFEKTSPEQLVRIVQKRALDRLNAPPAPAGELPIIIAGEAGGTLIHEALGHPLEADLVQKGISPIYKGKIGQVVANEKVSVYEDPTMSGQRGFYGFDDEGTPAQRVALIDHGVLRSYLYDLETADKDGNPSNGHGRRESFRHCPIPRMANTFVAPGQDDPAEILRSLDRGLLVTRMGGGQVETATGDFVFEVEEGFLIENGKKGPLIRSANLIGNGTQVLNTIDRVGSDMGWSVGTCGKDGQGVPVSDGLPTLRIPTGVIIGGIA